MLNDSLPLNTSFLSRCSAFWHDGRPSVWICNECILAKWYFLGENCPMSRLFASKIWGCSAM